MRVVVCSPFHHQSAIGRVAIETGNELAKRGHNVNLVSTELEKPSSSHPSELPIVFWKDKSSSLVLGAAEVIVVHIGDNYQFHAGSVHIVKHWRCVGVFHDANIYGLFRMWAFDGCSELEGHARHDREIVDLYGANLAGADQSDMHLRYDMTRWLALHCASALAHSRFYVPVLQAACPGNVLSTPLVYFSKAENSTIGEPEVGKLRILSFGHINPNKCCDRVIEAIAMSPNCSRAEYRIVGPVSDQEHRRLTALAATRGVKVVLTGYVADAVLADEIGQATIITCLRYPILEGASASAIEGMLAGKPLIVADSGFYAEIEDGAVEKIDAEVSIQQLAAALNRLASSSEERAEIGLRGKAWALNNCTVGRYVNVLEQAMECALLTAPYLELSKTFMTQLIDLGFTSNDVASVKIADILQECV